jgi:hypothetical protein
MNLLNILHDDGMHDVRNQEIIANPREVYEKMTGILAKEKGSLSEPVDNSSQGVFNFIINYISRTRQIDAILEKLTKKACANCDNPQLECKAPIGCCKQDYSWLNVKVPEFLALQEIEAQENISQEKGKYCKYHTEKEGCRLKLFKNPKCLGYVCSEEVYGNLLAKRRKCKYSGVLYENLHDALFRFSNFDLRLCKKEDNAIFFMVMDEVIEVGEEELRLRGIK